MALSKIFVNSNVSLDAEDVPFPRIKVLTNRYKGGYIGFLADLAIKSYDPTTDLCPRETIMINEIFYKSNYLITRFKEEHFGFAQDFFKKQYTFLKDTGCVCDYPDSEHYAYTFPEINCPDRIYHAKAHIISYIVAWLKITGIKSRVKYFRSLIKSVLSLDEEVFSFTPELIFRYDVHKNDNLVQLLLSRHNEKNLVVQQSGTSQSLDADCYDQMIKLFLPFKDYSLQELIAPKQQSWFTINHEHVHKADQGELDKLKGCLDDAQKSFLEGMKDTLLSTAKNLSIMFLTASTVALLTKLAVGISADIIFKLLHFLYSFVCGSQYQQQIIDSELVVQQSFLDGKLTIPFLPAMILEQVICPPKSILKMIWNSPETDKVMRRIGYLGDLKIEKGLDRIVEWITKLIKKVKRWYSKTILGKEVEPDLDENSEIVEWNEEISKLIERYYKGDFVWSEMNWTLVYNLYSRGLKFTRSPLYNRYNRDIWRSVSQLANLLQEFKKHAREGSTIRNPPVTIYLTGDTGVGKSSVTYPLAVEVLRDIFAEEQSAIDLKAHWKKLIYMRAPEQEYWDGYENQFVTVFDDFSQMVDSTANPNLELFEIIRASNCFPYPLHMASIEEKATTSFNSKMILVSSNLAKPDTHSLNFPAALQRRFDICVKVKRSEASKKMKLREFTPDIYEFTQYDMVTGTDLRNISYKQLIELCTMAYYSRRSYVDSINNYIERILDEPVKAKQQMGPYEELPVPPHRGQDMSIGPNIDESIIVRDSLSQEKHNIFETEFGKDHYLKREDGKRYHRNEFIKESKLLYNAQSSKFESKVAGFNWQPKGLTFDQYMDIDNINIMIPNVSYWTMFRNKCDEYYERLVDLVNGDTWQRLRRVNDSIKKKYDDIRQHWQDFKDKHPYWRKVAIVTTVIFAGLMFLKMFVKIKSMISPKKDKVMTPEAFEESYSEQKIPVAKRESYDSKQVAVAKRESYDTPKVTVAKRESERPLEKEVNSFESQVATEQGVRDLNAAEVLMKVARHNLYKMYESTTNSPIGHVMFIVGRIAVMPKHYIAALKAALRNDANATVYFEAAVLRRSFECRIDELMKSIYSHQSPDESNGPVYTRDIMALVVPTAIVHTNAVSYFVTRNDVSRVDSTEVMLPVLVHNGLKDSDRSILLLRFSEGISQLRREELLPVHDDDLKLARYVRDVWSYNMDTQPAECGAPLIVRNTSIRPGKICGLHIAGVEGTGKGFSTPIYQEDLQEILNAFPIEARFNQKIRLELKEFPKEQGQVPQEAEFIRLGKLDKPLPQPGKTNIRPSLAHASYKMPETKPCCLTKTEINGETFDPRTYRLGRLGNIPVVQNSKLINFSKEACLDEISQVLSKTKDTTTANIKAVYSFEEACVGIDGEDFVNAVKRDTSPGYPFVSMNGFTNRKQFFGKNETYDLTSPQCAELRTRVEEIISSAKRGEVLDHYFMDTLKDERKPIHKAHKTRLFAAGPLDYLIACKMYFNGVVALLQKNRNWCHVSVGTNPYSRDWTEIVQSLKRKASNMVAGDFEGFDASQHQLLLEAAGEILIQLAVRFLNATPEDVLVMRVLLVSLFNSLHITGSEVYQWTHSLPSGHYLTAIINSIFVNLSFGCIWQIAHANISYLCARSFWERCGIVAYGDDHIVSVPDSDLKIFNQLTVPELFQRIGLSYTMEDKDAVAEDPAREITEISYLKRKFRLDPDLNQWLAPLSMQTVLETPMWIHKCPDEKAQTIANLEFALKELSLHEKQVWKEWSPKLRYECEKLGHYTVLKDQDDVKLICLSQDLKM